MPERREIKCAGCGRALIIRAGEGDAGNAPFDREANARHCGNACKQRAYRKRFNEKALQAKQRAEFQKYLAAMATGSGS